MNGGGQPAVPNDPLNRLQTELGLPTEPFAEAIDTRAGAIVQKALGDMFGPIVREMEASEKLAGEVENFEALKPQARKFMSENQPVLETFNEVRKANPEQAWRYALQMMAAMGKTPQLSPHTGLPGGGASQGRSPVNPLGPDQVQKEGEALEYGRKFGDMSRYSHERYKGTSISRAVERALRQAGMLPEGDNQGW